MLSGPVIDFDDSLPCQELLKSIGARVETCAENHQLSCAILQDTLHMLVDEACSDEYQVRHSGHLLILAAGPIIPNQSSGNRMFRDQIQFFPSDQALRKRI